LMSLQADSPASPLALQESDSERTTRATCGPQRLNASAWYDHDSHSWKTFQVSFLLDTLEQFSETWPKAGMMLAGVFFPRRKWERRINEIGCGLWPTPKHSDATGGAAYHQPPHRQGGFQLKEIVHGGALNPTWVEWLQGWPLGWTDLRPLEMDKFRQWWRQFGACFPPNTASTVTAAPARLWNDDDLDGAAAGEP